MLLIPKKKEEQKGSAFTETQAKSITYNVEDINSNLYGFFGTLNKRDKKNFLKTKVQHMQLMEQLNKGDDASNSPKKKEADKKWFKIVGIMAKGIGGLFKGVASIAKGLASKATGLIGFLLGIFIILKLGLLKTLVPAALDMLKTLVTGIIELLPDIIKWAWDILVEWVPKLVNAFADAISNALGLSKESKLRKVMPYLVGIGAGLFALFKVTSMFGIGGSLFKGLLSGLKSLATFLISNPIALAIAGIVAAGVGIFEFVKNSEKISKWSKDKKKELEEQNKADLALIKKYQGTDLSKLNAETYKQLKEATERQAGFWKDIKSATLTGVGATADAVTSYKNYVDEQDKLAFKLRMKQNRTRKEEAELQLAAVNSWQIFTSDYWKAFANPDAWKIWLSSVGDVIHENITGPLGDYFSNKSKDLKKKVTKAFDPMMKTINTYWDKLKTGASDVWNKMPSVQDVKSSFSFSKTIDKMEEFFKPFTQRMKQIFSEIGDTFSDIVNAIIYGVTQIPGFTKLFGDFGVGKLNLSQFQAKKHLEDIQKDPTRKANVEAYAKAQKRGDKAKAAEIAVSLTDRDKHTADAILEMNIINKQTATSIDALTGFLNQNSGFKGNQVPVFRVLEGAPIYKP